MDAPTYRRLTRRLIEYSLRLEELTLQAGRAGPQALTPELLDEVAVTADELLLTLDEHRRACGPDDLIESVIAEARALTRGVRSRSLPREQVAEAASGVARGLGLVIREDKRAA